MSKTIVNVNGLAFEITNFDAFKNELMDRVTAKASLDIVRTIKELDLIDTSQFFQSIVMGLEDNGEGWIESDVDYAWFLEYGTLEFGERFTPDTYPGLPVKKKLLPKDLREQFPRGMNPFAPFRRTIYNRRRMEEFFTKSIRPAIRAIQDRKVTAKKLAQKKVWTVTNL